MQRTLQLAGAFYRARPVKQAGATMARGRNLACAASPRDGAPPARKAGEIMGMAANKATRFVYLRTLPLVKQPELEGQVDEVAGRIEDMTARLCEKHGGALVDERSAVHLHTAALAIATHRVLEPRIRDEWRLGNVIRAGYGAKLVPARDATEADRKAVRVTERLRPDFWVVRAALWMSFNRMKAIRKMTSNMARDFGQSFETTSTDRHGDEGETHSLLVTKCFYNTLCRDEGLPHLTKIFCALDRALYSPITKQSHGINFSLDQTLADFSPDDKEEDNRKTPACEFKFEAEADNNTR